MSSSPDFTAIDLHFLKTFFQKPYQNSWEEASKFWLPEQKKHSHMQFANLVGRHFRPSVVGMLMQCISPKQVPPEGKVHIDKDAPFEWDPKKEKQRLHAEEVARAYLAWLDERRIEDKFMQWIVAPRLTPPYIVKNKNITKE